MRIDLKFYGIPFTGSTGDAKADQVLRNTSDWIEYFVAMPHSDIGRRGPVCPRVPFALRIGSTHLAPFNLEEHGMEGLRLAVMELKEEFFKLPPFGPHAAFKTVGLILLQETTRELASAITDLQQELKLLFIERGILLGKFHSLLSTGAIHNPDFVPGKSPHPMLVVREMIDGDVKFLAHSTSPDHEKLRHLRSFEALMRASGRASSAEAAHQELSRLIADLDKTERG